MTSPLSALRISGSSITVTDLEQDLVKIDLSYSPTAKSKLIEALRTGRPLEDINIVAFTPLDLVVYIFALFQTSGIADKKKPIIRAFLELSQKFTTMSHYSSVNWQSLLGLLRTVPDKEKLIEFLLSEHAEEPDTMDFAFFCATWSELAAIFNSPLELSQLGLEQTFLNELSADWVSTCDQPEIIIDTLLFAYYICGGPRMDHWDQKTLISHHSYQEFIIKVIAGCKKNKIVPALLKECSNCFDTSGWQWAATLSENAIAGIIEIVEECPDHHVDQSICIHVLENQFVTRSTKVKLVSRVLDPLPELNLQILCQFFASLKKCIVGSSQSEHEEIRQLYVLLINKSWRLDLVVYTNETQNLLAEYCGFSGSCITNFITLTEAIYKDARNLVDAFMIKFFISFVNNLFTLEAYAKSRKSTQIRSVNEALIKIKQAAIRTIFKVYNILEDKDLKKSIFNYLAIKLVALDLTGSPEEFMVALYPSNDGKYTMLGFGFDSVSTQYVIVDQLPEEGL